MASFRIKFPEKEEPSVIVLNGARITVGRLPDNTIQIVDRVISSNHAELVLEDGHYRLRDLGSTNGTFVNDQFVTDFHLREACKVAFGTVECEFTLETPDAADAAAVEALPTRAELTSLRQENEKLTTQVAALREELDALHQVRPMTGEEAALGVPKAEYEKVTADREALKEAQERHHQEIARLKENLALLRRDRENLQRAWEITKAELNVFRPGSPGIAAAPPAAARERSGEPASASPATEPIAKPAILKPVSIAKPPTAKPPGFSPAPLGNTAPPTVRSLPTAAPAAPNLAAGTTVRAVPRAVSVPTATPGLKPIVRAPVAVPPAASGTQKMDPSAAETPKPAPKILPRPIARLGSSPARPLPTAVAQTPSSETPATDDGSAS